MAELSTQIKTILESPLSFARHGSNRVFRSYQIDPINAIINSIIHSLGYSFVIIFPRQSGKNEIQAHLQAYLLTIFSQTPSAQAVSVSPTWKPQAENAMFRLETVISSNLLSRHLWSKSRGYIYSAGHARLAFLSGSPASNIVGITANIALFIDEAQDIQIDKFDKEIAPMAASTNATRVFFGTAWTSNTLLAREEASALSLQQQDGVQRVWRLSCDDVSREVPAYGRFVAEQVGRLGRNHPMVRTQYYSEDIDASGGLFPPERLNLLLGSHPAQVNPISGLLYVSALDVAGEDESGQGIHSSPARDATALTIAQVDLSSQLPIYRIVYRQLWSGIKHTSIFSDILDLASKWGLKFLVCDATGVGSGLVSFLTKSLGNKIIPFIFSHKSKSDLAWSFLSLIDSGRFKDHSITVDTPSALIELSQLFSLQLSHCHYEIQPGPDKRITWGVPEGTRNLASGELVHDDLLFSAAMLSVLDDQSWALPGPALILEASDPLDDMKGF